MGSTNFISLKVWIKNISTHYTWQNTVFLKSCFSIKSQIHCPRGVQYLIKPYGESLHNVNDPLLTNFFGVYFSIISIFLKAY